MVRRSLVTLRDVTKIIRCLVSVYVQMRTFSGFWVCRKCVICVVGFIVRVSGCCEGCVLCMKCVLGTICILISPYVVLEGVSVWCYNAWYLVVFVYKPVHY